MSRIHPINEENADPNLGRAQSRRGADVRAQNCSDSRSGQRSRSPASAGAFGEIDFSGGGIIAHVALNIFANYFNIAQ